MKTVTATAAQARDAANKLDAIAALVEAADRGRYDVPEGAFAGVDLGPVTVKVRI